MAVRPWLRKTLMAMASLGLAILVVTWATTARFATFGGRPRQGDLERLKLAARYSGGIFWNEEPSSVMKEGTLATIPRWLFGKEMRVPTCPLPMFPDPARVLDRPPSSGLRITWLGHSTALIEIDGVRVLTDPMWSERPSPSTIVGPLRFHPPPLPFDALPKLDGVVISHDHYDHLDMATIQKLAARGVVIHAPLGIGAHLSSWGVPAAQIVEHDWWQGAELPFGVALVSTPARHFSGRGVLDRDRTLWTSWSLVGPTHRVFLSGDTGLTPALATIAERFGPFDVALLEIGQYDPSWGDIHLGPIGALEALARLRAKKLLPIHWSTFELGLHAWSEPAETLLVEAEKRGVAVLTPRLGEPIDPTAEEPPSAWWRALPPIASRCP